MKYRRLEASRTATEMPARRLIANRLALDLPFARQPFRKDLHRLLRVVVACLIVLMRP
jgi:hypothetical protein